MGKGFKKIVAFATACMLILACADCGEGTSGTDKENISDTVDNITNEDSNTGESGDVAADSDVADSRVDGTAESVSGTDGGVWIVYFSHSGNTHKLTEMIQAETGADVFRLTPVEEYGDDLFERAQDERNNGIRPEPTKLPEQDVIDQAWFSECGIGYQYGGGGAFSFCL